MIHVVADCVLLPSMQVISRGHLRKQQDIQKLETEIAIHGQLRHKNIVRFLGHFSDAENVYLMLEHCCEYMALGFKLDEVYITSILSPVVPCWLKLQMAEEIG